MRLLAALCLAIGAAGRPTSRPSPSPVEYTLRVDSTDLSGITVAMRIHGAPAGFRLAMVAHPEYDDQYWRYLAGLRGESANGEVRIVREDSSLWRVDAPPGDVTIHYRVRFPTLPVGPRPAWKAYLTPVGGLIGGPHSFLYVVGSENAPSTVTLSMPASWDVATGLTHTGSRAYSATSVETLADSPILVGQFRQWNFDIDGVLHRIAYLGDPAGVPFDTATFRNGVERLARETVRTMGHTPYRHYDFLFEDAAFGALEHVHSVTIGTTSANLAGDPNAYLAQTAHEFFHTWNLVNVRPANWIGVRRVAPPPTAELWWSEGVTLYFADLLTRRAGLLTTDLTRLVHTEQLMARYLANPSHATVSPEQTSRKSNARWPANGDYTPSMYTQGELLGVVLDLMIRDRTRGRRSLDDVMRTLAQRFTPGHGFTDSDLESIVGEVCDCSARAIFDRSVRGAGAPDVARWLPQLGLRLAVTWAAATAPDGSPLPDTRLSATLVPGDSVLRLQVWFPATAWGKAGLHSGDQLVSWNGARFGDVRQWRAALGALRVGDTVRVAVQHGARAFETTVTVPGYERPTVRIEERPDANDTQRALRKRWLAGQ